MADTAHDKLLRTPLYDMHVEAGAKIVPFAGWEMPLLYRGIVEEHQHTRTASSIFDVSHMGRIRVSGPDSLALLERLCTRRLADMPEGKVRYSHMCREDGGILDDLVVARYPSDRWLVICNASNRQKILNWMRQHADGRDVKVEDTTQQTAMVAVQGPASLSLLQRVLPFDLGGLKKWGFASGSYFGVEYYASRSGYTGEDGMEIIVPASIATFGWGRIVQSGEDDGPQIRPAGLGARDTLRLEAGLPLYGHELSEQVDPISAGLSWAVSLDKDFIGAEALRRVAETEPARKLVGLELEGRRIARAEMAVETPTGEAIGQITSGTFAPTIGRSVAMAYVSAEHAGPGTALAVRLREPVSARVVALPFYKRK